MDFDPKEMKEAKKRIEQMHAFMKSRLPNCDVFAITGGEPLLFPSLIEQILKVFYDTHVKISTNALSLDKNFLKMFKKHGNVSLCISLDGSSFGANRCRFRNKNIFDLVIKHIEEALSQGFLVEISCVLNKYNIGEFDKFSQWINTKWEKYLHQIVLIAYPITTYTRNPGPETTFLYSKAQALNLALYLKENLKTNPILNQTEQYYLDLANFLENKLCKKDDCKKYNWCLTLEYVNCSLWTSGNLISYGCGTKGDKSLGSFNLKEGVDHDLLVERKADEFLKKYFEGGFGECRRNCFTNWHMVDMLYSGYFKQSLPAWSKVYSH